MRGVGVCSRRKCPERQSKSGESMRRAQHVRLTFVASGMILLACLASAQAPVSLQEQLAAQYKLVKMTGNGSVVVEPGTLLAVQKGGIIGVPWKAVVHCAAKFQDNSLH